MVSDRDPAIRTGVSFAVLTSKAEKNSNAGSSIASAMFALSYFVTGVLITLAAPEIIHRVQVLVAQWH